MPNITEKGINVPIWMASMICGLIITLLGWAYNQQASINEKILGAINSVQIELRLNTLEKQYLNEQMKAFKAADEAKEKRLAELERRMERMETQQQKQNR